MAFRTSLLWTLRRFAAGIDVSPQAVRLVVMSRRLNGGGSLRIESMGEAPLAAGAMAGAEIVDRIAVANAVRDVFARMPPASISYALRCSMAIPASATLTATVPLTQLVPDAAMRAAADRTLSTLEPAVLGEAERIAGIERHALSVDWFIDESPCRAGSVTIAATGRQHFEARIECAAAAGVTLTALDGEPHAALRAMRYAATLEVDMHDTYAAIWVGWDGVHGWRIVDDSVAGEVRYPAPEYGSLADALRDLTNGAAMACAMVSGEIGLLEGVSFSLADIGDVLGCAVIPFECALASDTARPVDQHLLEDPAFAVAFGLALRGVIE
jgi:Tfp pilus assembly PilM family ATPase